jgi:hypothetical protein
MEGNDTPESIRQGKIGKPIANGRASGCIRREACTNRVSQRCWCIKSKFVALCLHDCNVPQPFNVLKRVRACIDTGLSFLWAPTKGMMAGCCQVVVIVLAATDFNLSDSIIITRTQ